MKIDSVKLLKIDDSRGEKTPEIELTSDNLKSCASAPSGKSRGRHEAVALPIRQVIGAVENLKPFLILKDFQSPIDFDRFLNEVDATPEKRNLGANTILVLSMAFWRLWSKHQNQPLFQSLRKLGGFEDRKKFPKLFFNLINGGRHAADSLPFQEYLFISRKDSPDRALKQVFEMLEILKDYLEKKFGNLQLGDEGGCAIKSRDPELGLKILKECLETAKIDGGLGLDAAASNLKSDSFYQVGDQRLSADELSELYLKFSEKYPLVYIEDPFEEEAWDDFGNLNEKIGQRVWIVGDDLTVTNQERIRMAKEKESVNALIIKPNQIGTITETLEAVKLGHDFGWKIIVSHRSGETPDTFIADLAFAVGADGFKAGSPLQKERLVKYQRLIEIESQALKT